MADLEKPGVEQPTEMMKSTEPEKVGLSLDPVPSPSSASVHTTDDSDHDVNNDLDMTKTLSQIDTADFTKGFKLVIVMFSIALSVFLVALDLTIIATAIPRITDDFHSLNDVGWYGSAFFLTTAAFQSTWGKALKYFPIKPTFMLSVLIFEIGSLICAVSKDSTTLIVGRAIAGVGASGVSSGAYTLIGFSVPPQRRAAFTGVLGATFSIASVAGPLLGGAFTSTIGWRWCFWINLPIGGLAAANLFFFFRTPKAARPVKAPLKEKFLQMDLPGTVVLMGAAICYILAMQWGGTTKAWSSADVVGTLVGFGLLVILFVAIEYYSGDKALLQGRLMKDRTIAAMCAFIFTIAGCFFMLLYYLPIYFQATRGVSASRSGIDNLPLVLGAGLFTMVSGIFITITGLYIPLMVMGTVFASVGAGLLYTLEIHTGSPKWIGYQALTAIGLGLVFQIPIIVGQSVVRPSDLSSVSSMLLFFQTIGGAIFISAAQAGFANRLLQELPKTAPGVDVAKVIVTGATDLRRVFSAQQIPGILDAYMAGLKIPFAIGVACVCVAFVLSFAPRWENIKGKLPMMQKETAAAV